MSGAAEITVRPSRTQPDYTAVIVGAGFGGLAVGRALRTAGISSFVLLDRHDGPGGCWRENAYPGAAADTVATAYSFTGTRSYPWRSRYAPRGELLSYAEDCTERFGLRDHLLLPTVVTAATFCADTACWSIDRDGASTITSRFLVMACGQAGSPRLPSLVGIQRFRGSAFHAANWPSGFSVAGRSVAIIGLGATAVQLASAVAPVVDQLHLIYRRPSFVAGRSNDPRRPNGGGARSGRFSQAARGAAITSLYTRAPWTLGAAESAYRKYLETQVDDPERRARLNPEHRIAATRPVADARWYETVNRSNVQLVRSPPVALDEHAIRTADGQLWAADVIVYATGFHLHSSVVPIPVVGLGGRELRKELDAGVIPYLSCAMTGFPNAFVVRGPHAELGTGSAFTVLEAQARYITSVVVQAHRRGLGMLDVRAERQESYARDVRRRMARSAWGRAAASGALAGPARTKWPHSAHAYRRATRRLDITAYRATSLHGFGPDGIT